MATVASCTPTTRDCTYTLSLATTAIPWYICEKLPTSWMVNRWYSWSWRRMTLVEATKARLIEREMRVETFSGNWPCNYRPPEKNLALFYTWNPNNSISILLLFFGLFVLLFTLKVLILYSADTVHVPWTLFSAYGSRRRILVKPRIEAGRGWESSGSTLRDQYVAIMFNQFPVAGLINASGL